MMAFIFLLIVVCLAPALPAAEPDVADYGRVMVVVYTTDGCAPCAMLKREYPRLHAEFPQSWWAWGEHGRQPATVSQHKGQAFVFMGAPIEVRAFPTLIIHVEREDGMYAERFRMTGFRPDDGELIETLIRRAAAR